MSKSPAIRWKAASAWAAIAVPGRAGARHGVAGVRIEPRPAAHAVSVVARSSGRGSLARIVEEGIGAALPPPGRLAEGRDGQIIWSGPDHWLLVTRTALPASLRRDLEGIAAVTDQSSARVLVDVAGPDARDALAKGFAIDLHPSIFKPGHTAVTAAAHISVQVWLCEDGRYTIAVPRSFASSFWSWLIAASSAYGYEVIQ